MTSNGSSGKSPDLVIIGAGAVGLWTAWKALGAGMSVRVLERSQVGNGASGGILGALMPHRPSQWTASKQFQLDALAIACKQRLTHLKRQAACHAAIGAAGA
jgi:glycine oxidase